MRKLIIIFILFFVSCSNNENYKVTMDSVIVSPETLSLTDYSGEIISLQIRNPSAKSIYFTPDITIYTKVDDKDYLVQRKNELSLRPTASFTFSFGGISTNSSSLGLIIESSKEYLVFNQKDFSVNPFSQKKVDFSINTNNLYYTKDKKNILVTREELYGNISVYHDGSVFRTIPFSLNLRQISE